MNEALLSSKSIEHGTPTGLIKALNGLGFNLSLDVCATPGRSVCPNFFAPPDRPEMLHHKVYGTLCVGIDGLTKNWSARKYNHDLHALADLPWSWMNPPYGRTIGTWMKYALDQSMVNDADILALVPSRTDTKWWHKYVVGQADVLFFQGRLKFRDAYGDEQDPAPFPSALVIYSAASMQDARLPDAPTFEFGDPDGKLNQDRFRVHWMKR